MAALSIAMVSLQEMKSSIGSNSSDQAYQIADSGVESVLQAIKSNPSATVNSLATSMGFLCSSGQIIGQTANGKFYIQLLGANDSAVDCNSTQNVSLLQNVKSIGVSGSDQRSIKAPVGFVCGGNVTATVNGTLYTYGTVYIPQTKQCWMEENLGATSTNQVVAGGDTTGAGWLFQWGRGADGHQKPNSTAVAGPSSSLTPGSNFLTSTLAYNYDWLNPSNNNLWGAAGGYINNPCPIGWHVPTNPEWMSIFSALNISNAATAYGSPLKLTLAGWRGQISGTLYDLGSVGQYWSNTPNSSNADGVCLNSSTITFDNYARAYGYSVRCIEN